MRSIEAVGKTVEEAINEGLEQLGVDRSQVQVEVIDEGNKGIFGLIGTKLARVNLLVNPSDRSLPQEDKKAEDQVGAAEKGQWAQDFLNDLLSLMGVQATVKVANIGEVIELEISGENMGLIIGHRGQTLDAIQYLTNITADKAGFRGLKIIVDAEDYRLRRKRSLENLAQRTAEKVIARRRRSVLEPMSPQDRRIIHLYLRDNQNVYTYSEGEDPFRKVVVDYKE